MRKMKFELLFTDHAKEQMRELMHQKAKKSVFKAVAKVLGLMETDLRHPSLNTHKYSEIEGPNGEDVFESYAQNRTPGAYRIFWHYGPDKGKITIIEICHHP
ncbi:hypothetical protein [Parachlamydia sp. AcF125]|uniref:hypothetical protein n=1 Tax=Parachlamydia sp. AcF125 TaxID=2795736 RepID=UPI001BD84614|nr:hypothetical protein [Parachlamydia sp. AcF125]MBS4167708.1 hypothetical protein [Parachlamydia sp. AcF125]